MQDSGATAATRSQVSADWRYGGADNKFWSHRPSTSLFTIETACISKTPLAGLVIARELAQAGQGAGRSALLLVHCLAWLLFLEQNMGGCRFELQPLSVLPVLGKHPPGAVQQVLHWLQQVRHGGAQGRCQGRPAQGELAELGDQLGGWARDDLFPPVP